MTPGRKIVVLGMLTKTPVSGVVWQTVHYLLGLQRLGFEPFYVEAHARAPSMLMDRPADDGALRAAEFIDSALRRFDLGGRWAYQALHDDGALYGISERELVRLWDEAELVINLHGGTAPREEHARSGRLVYLETDPVQLQLELAAGVPETIEFLEQHCAFFTFGENWGAADCDLPETTRFHFHQTRQPVCLDLWPVRPARPEGCLTTIGNWRQVWRDLSYDGATLHWSKHLEFEKVLDLPRRTGRRFELALSSFTPDDHRLLSEHGWCVRDAGPMSWDPEAYRDYVSDSLGEFTVAKEQNVRLRSGWFSDRSATYLAAGRPVVTQETGFSGILPVGPGLRGFSGIDEAAAAIEEVCSDLDRARRHAHELARECFAAEVVLGDLLGAVGVSAPGTRSPRPLLTDELLLEPVSRRPLQLAAETARRAREAPVPFGPVHRPGTAASVIVVSYDDLAVTRLCLESVLENSSADLEVVVVDNGSRDGTRAYLRTLARRLLQVRLILNEDNLGFPAACNQGLRAARGDLLVLLNNDAMVAPGWLERLAAHAVNPDVGVVGPVTNRIGNEAEVFVDYRDYGGFLRAAATRASDHDGVARTLAMPAMFCLAFRREVFERIGELDEQFGLGTLEDDDYAERVRGTGLRCVCAEDVLVHHFGEASFGHLYASGEHSAVLEENRRRFERKWDRPWSPYGRRTSQEYEDVVRRIRELVASRVPAEQPVIVASRGDDDLLDFPGLEGWHFPQTAEGIYAGHHPADSSEAIAHLELLREQGGVYFVLPATSFWWLDFYAGLRSHLNERYSEIVRDPACRIYDLREAT